MPDVMPPTKRRPGNPRPRLLDAWIGFRASTADATLLEAYAAATRQSGPAVLRGLLRGLRKAYGKLEKTRQAGES